MIAIALVWAVPDCRSREKPLSDTL